MLSLWILFSPSPFPDVNIVLGAGGGAGVFTMSLFRGDTGAIPCLKKAFTLVLQNVVWGYLNGRLLVYVTTSPLKRYRGNLSCVGFPRSGFRERGLI